MLCANMVLAPIEMIQLEFQSSSKLIKKQMSHFPTLSLLCYKKTTTIFQVVTNLNSLRSARTFCFVLIKSSCLSSIILHKLLLVNEVKNENNAY